MESVDMSSCYQSDDNISGCAPMQAWSSNAGKNYASARGEQPHIERDRDENWTVTSLEDMFTAGLGATGTGKSSLLNTSIKDNAEESDLVGFPTAVIPTSYQPYFSAYMPLAPMYCVNVDICGTHDFNDANMSNTDQYNFPEHHISLNSTADDFDTHFDYTMSHPGTLAALDTLVYPFYHKHAEAIDPNHEEAGPRGLGMWHFRCSDEDDMSSGSSIDAESLFDYSPSESEATSTVGSSAVQQELTYTNIEHMLTVLKAERGKCLGELRGLDAALETIDQLANRKRPGSRGGNARII
ncbi:hypothetical protein V8E51_016433 [Hyaloscypha variabilis]